jgi:L-aspartate oxidase
VHGANRLASNSLLEGVVFGARAGRRMRERCGAPLLATRAPDAGPPVLLPANAVFELRRLAWRRAGIERSGESIREGLEELERLAPIFRQGLARNSRQGFEANNMFEVVSLIARCALAREESRGCHFRSDFPLKNPEFQKHSLARSGAEVTFV